MTAPIVAASGTAATGRPRRPGWYFLRLEVIRVLTNVSTLVFCCAMPLGFYLLFGAAYGKDQAGVGNMNAVVLAMMGIYGAVMTATAPAYTLPTERVSGWNRQLRLTPLRPLVYVGGKVAAAVLSSLACLIVLYGVGLALRQAEMPASVWFGTLGIAWLGSLGFAAMGLFIGLVMRKGEPAAVIVPITLVCSFLSDAFQLPVSGRIWDIIQNIVPMGGLVRWSQSLFGPDIATTDWKVWVNVVGWTLIFTFLAALAFSRDSKRG
ncbi:MAG: ABC transporter permease [Propionibacteriaceae bacterium]|jgi:ABC-2 type transport system permease protein|nr:ABC transporter permease [Propionibacteriaceae bacterium]